MVFKKLAHSWCNLLSVLVHRCTGLQVPVVAVQRNAVPRLRKVRSDMRFRSRTIEELETVLFELLCNVKDSLMSKLDDLKADVADYHAKVVAKVDDLKAQITALQGQVGGVSDADLQTVIDAIDAAKGELAPPVVAAPVEAPVEVADPVAEAPVEVAPVAVDPAPEAAPAV